MAPQRTSENTERLAQERRLQVAGALLLGGAVLVLILLRADVHTVFPPGWWHHL